MDGSFKPIHKSDIIDNYSIINKKYFFDIISGSSSNYFFNDSGSYFSIYTGSLNNEEEKPLYDVINHLFFQEYPNNLQENKLNLLQSLENYINVSEDRPLNKYNEFYTNSQLKNYKLDKNGFILININKEIFGNKIKPGSLKIKLTNLGELYDDENGNIFIKQFESQIGYIFYEFGLILLLKNWWRNLFISEVENENNDCNIPPTPTPTTGNCYLIKIGSLSGSQTITYFNCNNELVTLTLNIGEDTLICSKYSSLLSTSNIMYEVIGNC